jgi:hypothetical protein
LSLTVPLTVAVSRWGPPATAVVVTMSEVTVVPAAIVVVPWPPKVKAGPPTSVTEAPLTVSPPEVPLLTSTGNSPLDITRTTC